MIEKNYRYAKCSYPAEIKWYKQHENTVSFAFIDNNGEKLYGNFAFFRNGIVRIQLCRESFVAISHDFVNQSALLTSTVMILQEEDCIAVEYDGYTAIFSLSPFNFKIIAKDGRTIYQEQMNDVNPVGEGLDRIFPMGFTVDSENNTIGTNVGAQLHYDEHIYGLGERFTEFDKRGQRVTMINCDTLGCRDERAYKNIPFYVSTYGYGLFVHTHHIAEFNIGRESLSTISVHVPDSQLEYFILVGETPMEIVSNYMNLTGPAVLPPDWSFGLWYSNGFKNNSRELVEKDAKRFREEKIPCDVMHFDCFWLRENMWCDFVWNDKQYPNRKEMLKNLHEDGYKVCLWINPYITITSPMFIEGEEQGYLVKTTENTAYTADLWHGLLPFCGIIDFTNPEAILWYEKKLEMILSEGVDVLKTDFAEEIPLDGVFHSGESGDELRNLYASIYNQITFDVIKRMKGKSNAMVWARSGFIGMQRLPVCWSGDPHSSFEGMAETLRGGLSLAMSGVPFWSHDMGGFYGDVSEEMFIRWSQFGLFCSHSRLHGTTTRQPWAYGERALDIVRKFVQLRYKLMPYILKTAMTCSKNNKPFIRPLVLEHPYDPTVYAISDQYYFGDDLLVAPVFGGDNASRRVYLPKGKWTDLLTGNIYVGEHWHNIICSLEYMPVFIKNDADIPMCDDEKQFL